MSKSRDFVYVDTVEPHVDRCKMILKKHPEIRNLMGRNPNTIFYITGIVLMQIFIAYLLRDQAWWVILLAAYCIGAFANHGLFVLIHDCTHNLIFKKRVPNILAGILCDLPNAFPASVGFRTYHLKHHAFQGNYDRDADLPSRWEARLIGDNFFLKALWLLFFPVFQGLRPPRLKEIKFSSGWTWINLGTVIVFDILIVYFIGWAGLLYFGLSFFFSVGLHPLGARWIQEHYLVAFPQETYSYYGPLNKVAFNVGYHNEHHDFSFVAWNNLPKIRAIAPEFYDTLYYHTSWTKLLFRWLKEGDLTLFSRSVRDNIGKVKITGNSEEDFLRGMKAKEMETAAS